MQTSNHEQFARAAADAVVHERYGRIHGVHTLEGYLDLTDARSTAHLDERMAARCRATSGQQRRNTRVAFDRDGALIVSVPMRDSHQSGATIWAEIDLHVWLDLLESGADLAWFYAHKGQCRRAGQVRTKVPFSGQLSGGNCTIARLILNAKPGQQARIVDGNPLNLRRSNLYLLGTPWGKEGRKANAKTDTSLMLLQQHSLRKVRVGRGYGIAG